MKASVALGLSIAVTFLVAGSAAVYLSPYLHDLKRERDYRLMRYSLELGVKSTLADMPLALPLTEDPDQPWMQVVEEHPGVEVYVASIYRSGGLSGRVAVVLDYSAPKYYVQIEGQADELRRQSHSFGPDAAWRIANTVAMCQFWSLESYGTDHGTDGDVWIFTGYAKGRVRSIDHFCPEGHGLVFELCRSVCETVGSELSEE